MSWSGRVAAASLTLGVLACATACGGASKATAKPGCTTPPADAKLRDAVVVLIDRSRSTGTPAIQATYTEAIDGVLTYLKEKGGGLVAIAPIDENSLAHFNPIQCVYPKNSASANPLVYGSKASRVNQAALARAVTIIHGPRTTRGTTIFDALTSAGRLLHKQQPNADHRYLVILSDMVEESERMSMSPKNLQPATIDRFIRNERTGPFFPKLGGVEVYVVGAGVSAKNGGSSVRAENIERFWLKYFAATGAQMNPDNYGSSLAFP